jgi:tripartite-type tricarboxylate transporter receptor subunit TctC
MFLIIGLIAPWKAQADWQPSKTIMVHIGFGAGGGIDTVVRVITNEISKNTGWNFTVINKPGGGGSVALKGLKKETADGHAICLTPSEVVTFNPTINPKVGFVPDDFTYIAAITRTQGGLVCLADKPWKTFGDVIEAAKAGEKISVAYQAPKMGMSTKAIEKVLGVKFTLVPVKGGAAGMKNVLGKHVDIAWSAGIHAKYVNAGQMKVLASVEKEKLELTPEAPTVQELGVKYVSLAAMFTFIGPKGMPEEIVQAFAKEIIKASEAEKIKDLLSTKMAMKPIALTGGELQKAMDQSLAESKELVKFVKQ